MRSSIFCLCVIFITLAVLPGFTESQRRIGNMAGRMAMARAGSSSSRTRPRTSSRLPGIGTGMTFGLSRRNRLMARRLARLKEQTTLVPPTTTVPVNTTSGSNIRQRFKNMLKRQNLKREQREKARLAREESKRKFEEKRKLELAKMAEQNAQSEARRLAEEQAKVLEGLADIKRIQELNQAMPNTLKTIPDTAVQTKVPIKTTDTGPDGPKVTPSPGLGQLGIWDPSQGSPPVGSGRGTMLGPAAGSTPLGHGDLMSGGGTMLGPAAGSTPLGHGDLMSGGGTMLGPAGGGEPLGVAGLGPGGSAIGGEPLGHPGIPLGEQGTHPAGDWFDSQLGSGQVAVLQEVNLNDFLGPGDTNPVTAPKAVNGGNGIEVVGGGQIPLPQQPTPAPTPPPVTGSLFNILSNISKRIRPKGGP